MGAPKTSPIESSFRTDTATLAVFDPERLRHRLDDDADWWSIPDEEVAEINAGNVLSVSTGVDGDYLLNVYLKAAPHSVDPIAISALIKCESGELYFHAGEYVPAGELMPHTKYGGLCLELTPGTYRVTVVHSIEYCLDVFVEPADAEAINEFEGSPCVPWPSKDE